MTRKMHKMLVLGAFCLFFTLTSIPGFMMKARQSNISSVKSALLNPKYAAEVNEITLSFPDDGQYHYGNVSDHGNKITISKSTNLQGRDIWLCSLPDGMIFPANTTVISQLIERTSSTISMVEISDSYTSWSALGLSDDTAINMTFSVNRNDGSSQQFSSLFFGYENADSSLIYVRSDRKSNSWRINNTYAAYLSGSVYTWADQALLPTGSMLEEDPAVSSIIIQSAANTKTFYNTIDSATFFDDVLHSLLSLRSSEYLSVTDFSLSVPQAVPVLSITLSGSEKPYGLTVYEAAFEDGAEYEYYVRNFGIISERESSYVQKISSWTYEKIQEITAF